MSLPLVVNGLSAAYSAAPVIKDVSFSLAEGECVPYLGPTVPAKPACSGQFPGCSRQARGPSAFSVMRRGATARLPSPQ